MFAPLDSLSCPAAQEQSSMAVRKHPDKRKTAERYRAGRPAFACRLRVGRPLSPGS